MPRLHRNYANLLWVGLFVYVAGRLVDLWWHSTHPGFETAADQVQAHLVVWVGGALMLAAAVWALAGRAAERGYAVVAAGGLLYAGVVVWHFMEHAAGRDPDLPHVLLAASGILLIGGAAWVGLARWRTRESRAQ